MLLVGLFANASLAAAEQATTETSTGSEATLVSDSNYWQEHFSLHGYLSLSFADASISEDRPATADESALGIESGGTFPYGNAALQLRYMPAARHLFLLQVATSELGDSPIREQQDDLELDWLFYEFQPTDSTRLRVGRLPAPVGIFNELRDVGVVLPFFRPPFTLYREGALWSETVDGVGISQTVSIGQNWSISLDAYYGEYEVFQQAAGFVTEVSEYEATDALGGQIWLETPVDGLRFGLGAIEWSFSNGNAFSEEPSDWNSWYVSLDGVFDRWIIRSEYRRVDTDLIVRSFPTVLAAEVDNAYLQLGWRVTDKLAFYVQPEVQEIGQRAPLFEGGSTSARDRADYGISVVYSLHPSLVLKAEYHQTDSEVSLGNELIFGPTGPVLRPAYLDTEGEYLIAGVAMSF